MNRFRSEEHARNWSQFDPNYDPQPLSYYLELFSREQFKARARPDFISWRASQRR
jgi:hypothetical protein